MSEFEKELEKNMKLGKVAHERESLYSDFLVSKRDIERIFEDWQPPKPLVEVPQCVDDAIKALPKYYSIYGAIGLIHSKITEFEEENEDWLDVYNWIFKENNANKFARAWLDGYTVEKEQMYEVVFAVNEDGDRYLLLESDGFFIDNESMNEGYYKQQFTEQEIKKIDPRYWAFAVKVEEVEP